MNRVRSKQYRFCLFGHPISYALVRAILDCNLIKEGDLVKKGDILLLIINNTLKRNVKNAKPSHNGLCRLPICYRAYFILANGWLRVLSMAYSLYLVPS